MTSATPTAPPVQLLMILATPAKLPLDGTATVATSLVSLASFSKLLAAYPTALLAELSVNLAQLGIHVSLVPLLELIKLFFSILPAIRIVPAAITMMTLEVLVPIFVQYAMQLVVHAQDFQLLVNPATHRSIST